jgi:hypothetical protein
MAQPGLVRSFRQVSEPQVCLDWEVLFDDFVKSIRELIVLEAEQWNDRDRQKIDLIFRAALERKRRAKEALIEHQRTHACSASTGPAFRAEPS